MNFAIFSSAPLYKLLMRATKKPIRFSQFILFICLFAWLPLLVLTLLSSINVNLFLTDFDVHVRLLVSLSLLLFAEAIAENRFQVVVNQFIYGDIIHEQGRKKFNSYITSAMKWSNSNTIEIILFLFVIIVGRWVSQQVMPYDISAWYATKTANTISLTLPGIWYAYVSLPIFQFILLRWYYRIVIWYFFLWQIAKLPLQLNSLHPDRAGGIGFLINSVFGLAPFLMAQAFLLSGVILNAILNTHHSVWNFQYEIISWLILLILVPLIPLTFFVLRLIRNKRIGTNAYSVIAIHYVNAFKDKWIHEKHYNEKMLGSPDIQSLADLGNSFNVSAQMQIFPIKLQAILVLLIFLAIPFLPLLLTEIPINKLLIQLAKMVF